MTEQTGEPLSTNKAARANVAAYLVQARQDGRKVDRGVVAGLVLAEERRLQSRESPPPSGSMTQAAKTMQGLHRQLKAKGVTPTPDPPEQPVYECTACDDAGMLWVRAGEADPVRFVMIQNPVTGAMKARDRDGGRLLAVYCADCPPATQLGRHILMESSLTPHDWRESTFGRFLADTPGRLAMRDSAQRWAVREPGTPPFLMLSGTVGTGKSHLAKAAAFTLATSGHPVLFQTAREILEQIKASYDRADEQTVHVTERQRSVGVLVLDDLGAEHGTDWAHSELAALLTTRYEGRRMTMITTNRDLEGLAVEQGDVYGRLVDRLSDKTQAKYVRVVGDSWRQREEVAHA